MIPEQPLLPWKVCITLLHAVSVLTTGMRIEYRRRTRRLWWDDYAAILPAVVQILNVSVIWLRLQHFAPGKSDRSMQITFSYLSQFSFGCIIWWSRISLALAILRITPIWSKSRPYIITFTFAFIVNWVGLSLAMSLACATHTEWQDVGSDILICGPAYKVTVASVATDILGDILLVGFPLYRLWRINLPKNQRRLVFLVFSTSMLTLVAAVGLTIISYGDVLEGPGALLVWLMTVHIEEAISLIACNLPVLIPWGYRTFSRGNDIDDSDRHITPHWSIPVLDANTPPTFVLTSRTTQNIDPSVPAKASLHDEAPIKQHRHFNNSTLKIVIRADDSAS